MIITSVRKYICKQLLILLCCRSIFNFHKKIYLQTTIPVPRPHVVMEPHVTTCYLDISAHVLVVTMEISANRKCYRMSRVPHFRNQQHVHNVKQMITASEVSVKMVDNATTSQDPISVFVLQVSRERIVLKVK